MAYFTDNEPLNIDKLNLLESRINTLEADLVSLRNKYQDANGNSLVKFPVFETGTIIVGQGVGTKSHPVTLTKFTSDENPTLLVSPRGELDSKQYISISTTSRARNPQIHITSNVALKNQPIDWVAIVLREQ